MSNGPVRTMASAFFAGLCGAILGVFIGGGIGQMMSSLGSRQHIEPISDTIIGTIDLCLGFAGMIVGAGIGGTIGGVVGAVFGAGFAARTKAAEIEKDSAIVVVNPANTPEPATESHEPELQRLKEKVADLDGLKQTDVPSKEG